MIARAALAALALAACSDGSSPGQPGDIRYEPPNTDFATELGLTPPVSADEARAIAEDATGGTALGVDQETENGELLYEVQVETSEGRKEVEVRASDGGVVEIEAGDDD
jgi:uncharacterized membrane protein YkoI